MKILFTKGRNPISALIRHLTGEPVSHVAFCFDDAMVMHINLSGFHIQWKKDFLKKACVVFEVERILPLSDEEIVYQKLLPLVNSGYDVGGFFYWGWRAFLKKYFRKPMPEKNKLAKKSRLWCIEVAEGFREQLNLPKRLSLDTVTPYQFYKILKGIK